MANQVNAFALLVDDDEGEDLSNLLANVAAKLPSPTPVEKKTKKSQPGPDSTPADSGRVERGRGGRGGGRGPGRVGSGGYEGENGRANGGYQRSYGGDADANGRGRGGRGSRGRGGGRGRGRGFNEDRGFGYESEQIQGGENIGESADVVKPYNGLLFSVQGYYFNFVKQPSSSFSNDEATILLLLSTSLPQGFVLPYLSSEKLRT